jgi:hypothetical protein
VDRALWFLLWLRLVSWVRRLGRNLRTVKGILLTVFGLVIFIPWLFSVLLVSRPPLTAESLQNAQRYGPLALLVYCLLSLSFTSGENVIAFTAAEVDLLFPGPFSRRQLLAYKLTFNFGLSLISALFFVFFLRIPVHSVVAGYLGIVLTLLFIQLFALALGLLANTVGVRAYSRVRKVVLAAVVAGVLGLLLYAGRDLQQIRPGELLTRLEQTPWYQALLAPLRWFILAATADGIGPDFFQWAGLSLAVDVALAVLVFALDAHYLEGSAAAAERLYVRLQQLRSGGPAAVSLGRPRGKPRWRVPSLPWWGGAGPVAWRQLTTMLRSRGSLVLFIIVVVTCAGPLLAGLFARDPKSTHLAMFGAGAGAGIVAMTLFLNQLVGFDFRSDIDRMDVLKTLPIRPGPLVVGQLIAPTLLISGIQWLAVAGLILAEPQGAAVYLAVGLLAVPFNFFLFGMENLLFLLFPTRLLPATPGDFQAFGRNLLLTLFKFIGFGVAGVTTFLVAALVYFLTGRSLPAALAAAWVVLSGFAAGLVPLAALAFRRYDVARDTPP